MRTRFWPEAFCQLCLQLVGKLLQVNFLQELLDGFRAHASLEIVLIFFPHIAVFLLRQDLLLLQLSRIAGVRDNIHGEVEHLFQHAGRNVEHQAHPGRNALEIPDMRNRSGQLNVAHALAAHLGTGDFHAAAVADLALVADALILAAMALPVLLRPENALAEQAVALRLQGAVVDGFRLLDLAVATILEFYPGTQVRS